MKSKLNEAEKYLLYILSLYGGKKHGRKTE